MLGEIKDHFYKTVTGVKTLLFLLRFTPYIGDPDQELATCVSILPRERLRELSPEAPSSSSSKATFSVTSFPEILSYLGSTNGKFFFSSYLGGSSR